MSPSYIVLLALGAAVVVGVVAFAVIMAVGSIRARRQTHDNEITICERRHQS